jgi:hypothetical protein
VRGRPHWSFEIDIGRDKHGAGGSQCQDQRDRLRHPARCRGETVVRTVWIILDHARMLGYLPNRTCMLCHKNMQAVHEKFLEKERVWWGGLFTNMLCY